MPYAVTLRLDDSATKRVEEMWKLLARSGISESELASGYAPHITLAGCDETIVLTDLIEIARNAAAGWQPFSVTLEVFKVFPGDFAVLWIAPAASDELFRRHAEVCAALPASCLHPYFRPENWVPHVTLAKDLKGSGAVETAIAAVSRKWEPFEARLERLDVIYFEPVRLLWQRVLRSN